MITWTGNQGPSLGPQDPQSLVLKANALLEREAYAEAIDAYRTAIAQAPDHEEAHFNLAAALAATGDVVEAISIFQGLLAKKPDVAAAHAGLARALDAHRIDRFEAGIQLPATDALDEALRAYRAAIDAVPALYGCYSSLEQLMAAIGRQAEAADMRAVAETFTTDLPDALLNVGATMQHPGNLADAVGHHRRAMALAPDHDYMTEQDYLETSLTFTDTEILLPDGFEVMMEWERPIMERSAEIVCHNHGAVLNVGFGMGIIDTAIQRQGVEAHSIIEAHPQVVEKARSWAADKTGVTIVPSTWQDALSGLPAFDGIYFDTLMPPMIPFLERVPAHLKPGGVFLYFQSMIQFENLEAMVGNGLGFGIEMFPFDEVPENHYYRLNEKASDGRYRAPMFVYQKH